MPRVRLTVGFLDNPPADLRARIVSHMNAWGAFCNVQFTETATNPQVRIARAKALQYFESTQGWSEAMVIAQVLTPLDAAIVRDGPAWGPVPLDTSDN